MTVPQITLNDGVTIPQLGFGTMDIAPERDNRPESHEITAAGVQAAIEVGYRHFDTAQMYGNERGVGLGIARSGLPRDEFFITSKLGNGNHRPDDVRRSFDQTVDDLGVERLDLFLIHWPLPTLYDGDYVSTWRAVTALVEEGRLRSAGVSNFLPHHLERIIGETGHTPSVNQIEVHPAFTNDEVRAACATHGIVVEAWSPLGKGAAMDDSVIGRIAQAVGRTPAEVVLRWHLQRGWVVIPKTATPTRMAQNFSVTDFTLTAADMAAIDALDRGIDARIGPDSDTFAWVPTPEHTRP